MQNSHRSGVIAAGNFVVDHVKIIDEYPSQDHLALVSSETDHNGGGPYNLLRNLVALGAAFPLFAEGLVGDDRDGRWIIEDCRSHGIDASGLHRAADAGTSWTDVMSVASTGRRTFFHHPGSNDVFRSDPTEIVSSGSKIFYLGYLTMLAALDALDSDGRTMASRVLERACNAGIATVADLASRKHPRFRDIVASAAPFLDYLFLNEVEANWLLNREGSSLETDYAELERAAREILALGIRRAVIIHFEFGSVYVDRGGYACSQPAVNLPKEKIVAKVGAGDAFAAGFVLGLHEAQTPSDCLLYAVSAAATCLLSRSASDGILPLHECLQLAATYGEHGPAA